MRQHRLALCKDHFTEWIIQQTERFIQKYHMFTKEDRILVAVSGGKDSLSLWDVLWRAGYAADGLYIQLGIDQGNYSEESSNYSIDFARERDLKLHVVNVRDTYGVSIIEMSKKSLRGKGRPCAVCGLVKRYIMNQVAHDGGYTVLTTGHNLDDEAAVLFGNTLHWSLDMLARQAPVLEAKGGLARKTKPFCRFYERETAAYAFINGIDYIYDECPFSYGSKSLRYKELLNRLEEKQPGTKLNFYIEFLKARKNGVFSDEGIIPEELASQTCSNCGQLTTAPDKCAFCRMLERIAEK
jgi:uncharacterized protein (TIGR00269 family)